MRNCYLLASARECGNSLWNDDQKLLCRTIFEFKNNREAIKFSMWIREYLYIYVRYQSQCCCCHICLSNIKSSSPRLRLRDGRRCGSCRWRARDSDDGDDDDEMMMRWWLWYCDDCDNCDDGVQFLKRSLPATLTSSSFFN